ncbi:MAG: ATP-binding cassette domain-containing protein [Cupriavidus sp.]|nr:ATP-binding cassette domain-containing protein [Cupriavidus sp.]
MRELQEQLAALTCRNVGKTFPLQREGNVWRLMVGLPTVGKSFTALTDVSLSVPKGKIVGILGHNGAGKSTLLRVLGGVYQPTVGTISVEGSVCGLFEMGGTGNPHLTGREYAHRYFMLMGVPRDRHAALLEDIQEFSELGADFDRRVLTYSAGMAARLYFATATAIEYDVFLIDELLSVGDEHFQAKCWSRMRKLLLNGASGILVTHDWVATLRLCEYSHILKRGRIVDSGASDAVVVNYLGLPLPHGQTARFAEGTATEFRAISGHDATFRFEIEVDEPARVAFAYSIEMMRIGTGWEVLMIESNILVAEAAGRHEITLAIDKLPLVPGEYSINVALNRYQEGAVSTAESFDARGWTTGNGWKLEVGGAVASTAVNVAIDAAAW